MKCRDHRPATDRSVMNQAAEGEAGMAADRFLVCGADRCREHTHDPASPVVQDQRPVGEAVAVVGEEPARVQECAIARSVDETIPVVGLPGRETPDGYA